MREVRSKSRSLENDVQEANAVTDPALKRELERQEQARNTSELYKKLEVKT